MPPVTVMIKPVSGACNMHCDYCFYADEMKHRGSAVYPAMTKEILEMTVRRSMAYADGEITFVFQGGEPTLAGVDFYRSFNQFLNMYNTRALHIHKSIQTNGYEMSDEMISLLAENHFLVGISLDGTQDTHDCFRKNNHGQGTYRQIKKNIIRLERANIEYNILCVLNRCVAENAEDVLKELWAFRYLQFIPCMDGLDGESASFTLTNEAYARFLEASFQRYEQAFQRGEPVSIRQFDNWIRILLGFPPENCAMRGRCSVNFLIESNGDVYPCDFYALDQWKLGNVHEQSFRQMLRTPVSADFVNGSVIIPACCQSCRWYPLCRNGCRRERDPQTGVFRLCDGTRLFLEKNVERLQKIAYSIRRK